MSLAFAGVHFLRPHWLWALLALPLLWGWWRVRLRRSNVWRESVDAHLLPHLLEPGGKAARSPVWLGLLGYALAVFALAGPSWRQDEQPLLQSQAPLVVALDLSGAVAAADLPPSRLLQARAKLATLLRERRGGQVALVAFAGDAFTVAPLTDDTGNVALFLDALDSSVMPIDGQNAARAIEWSARLLRQSGHPRGDILLLTDRAASSAHAAAAKAAGEGYRVSALGLGTANGAAYRTPDGRIERAWLDADSLRALAAAGNGRYQALAPGDGDLRMLGVLDPRQAAAQSEQGTKGLAWRDEGYWLLLPLMLLGLFAFRRGAVAALAVCALLPLSQPAFAAEGSPWRRPDQRQHTRIEQGAAAYREGDFETAEQAFAGVDSADGFYNRGNALARQGRYDEAIAAYDEALARQPAMEDAIANRKAVEQARKRQQAQDGQDRKNRQQGSSGQDRKPQSGQDPSQPQDGDGRQSSSPTDPQLQQRQPQQQPQQQRQQADGNPPKKPEQSQDQQAADAAQRERMRQAMERKAATGEDEQAEGKRGVETETPEQRERRQAVEAWLRRVPDDPGGLLRAKFRIEHERRQREGR